VGHEDRRAGRSLSTKRPSLASASGAQEAPEAAARELDPDGNVRRIERLVLGATSHEPHAHSFLVHLLFDPGCMGKGEMLGLSRRVGSETMERAEFERKLKAEGYTELFDRQMEVSGTGPEHSHEFDALLLVLKGEMTIACNGKPQTYRAGDLCSVPAGTPHTEQFGWLMARPAR
jgi:mannose-6-phosphate isomerase-like protein (cupin superfamily)